MELINQTSRDMDFLQDYVKEYDTEGLRVYMKDIKAGARVPYSGVCYYKKGRIRVSINPKNRYPLTLRVGSPFNKESWKYYQMKTYEDIASFVFLHELSHYLDYKNNVPVRCKQTKSDNFALKKMGLLK
jgi:hypothetical protein